METHFEKMEQQHGTLARKRVFADLQALASDAEDLLKATIHDVNEKTREVRSRLASAVERAKETCNEMQASAAATGKAAAEKTDNLILTHPYESLGLAFGLGLLIGVLVIRK